MRERGEENVTDSPPQAWVGFRGLQGQGLARARVGGPGQQAGGLPGFSLYVHRGCPFEPGSPNSFSGQEGPSPARWAAPCVGESLHVVRPSSLSLHCLDVGCDDSWVEPGVEGAVGSLLLGRGGRLPGALAPGQPLPLCHQLARVNRLASVIFMFRGPREESKGAVTAVFCHCPQASLLGRYSSTEACRPLHQHPHSRPPPRSSVHGTADSSPPG